MYETLTFESPTWQLKSGSSVKYAGSLPLFSAYLKIMFTDCIGSWYYLMCLKNYFTNIICHLVTARTASR